MPFLDWLKNVFSTSSQEVVPNMLPERLSDFESEILQKAHIVNAEQEFPYWLSNEDALKDEGVIFGLSGVDPTEKIKIIEALYESKSADITKKIEELAERIGEYNLSLEKKQIQHQKIDSKIEDVKQKVLDSHNLLRVIIGLLFSAGMCIGNFYLIDHYMSLGFEQNHHWVALGIFLTGMFSVFRNISIMHDTKEPLSWRSIIEEFGVPLAASFMVFVQTWGHYPPLKSFAVFGFVFMVFLVSGKVLLSSLVQLKTEWNLLIHSRELKREKSKIEGAWATDLVDIETYSENIRIEKWKIIPELNRLEAKLSSIRNEKEALINVFMSEYNLAQSFKNKLSSSQIKNIIGQ